MFMIILATVVQFFIFFRPPYTKIKIPKVEDHVLAIQAPAQIAASVGETGLTESTLHNERIRN